MRKQLLTISAALIVAGVLFFSPGTSYAAEEQADYLALGDSITAGYRLADPTTQSFAALVAKDQNLNLTNLAVSGNTMANLRATIVDKAGTTPAISDEAIENADIISITAGGNDAMHALYEATATKYNAQYDPDITAADVPDIMSDNSDDRRSNVLITLLTVATDRTNKFVDSAAFQAALTSYAADLKATTTYVHEKNPDAVIFIDTQYNPYGVFESGWFASVYTAFDECTAALNAVIKANQTNDVGEQIYQVVDVAARFKANVNSEGTPDFGASLCNASFSDFDFHPNVSGHQVIASTILSSSLAYSITAPQTITLNGVTATLTFSTNARGTTDLLPNVPVTATITFSGQPDSSVNAASYKLSYSNAETGISGYHDTEYLPADAAVSESTTFTFAMPASDVDSFNLELTKNDPIPLTKVSINATEAVVGTALFASIQPGDATATYQWYANGIAIPGATNSTYTPVVGDIGKKLSVKATGTMAYDGTVESGTSLTVKAAPIKPDSGGTTPASNADTVPYTGDGNTWQAAALLAALCAAGLLIALGARRTRKRA